MSKDCYSKSGPITPPARGTAPNTSDPAKFRNQGGKARYTETRTTKDTTSRPPRSKGAL